MIVHTHPSGQNAAPSPSDASTLAKTYKANSIDGDTSNITANVIIAADGSEYVVYVNDRTAFTSFCNDSNNSEFTEPASGGLFKSGTQWANDYEAAKTRLTQQGYSQNDAQSYALSYVLDHYNTGIKIYQKKNGVFKEQKTTKTNNNYNPQICQ
jgi:hypothetical protein